MKRLNNAEYLQPNNFFKFRQQVMITTTLFVTLYWLSFLIYASRYSSVMQEINKDYKRIKIKGVNAESVKSRIEIHQIKIGKMKRIIWPLNIVIFLVHLITLSVSNEIRPVHFIGAALMLAVNILLISAITWMKGAKAIDDNSRMSNSPRM